MLKTQFLPFPELESQRLRYRRPDAKDVKEMFLMRSNPEIMRYIPRPIMTNASEALAHLQLMNDKIESGEGINWAVTYKDDDRLLGVMGHFRIEFENYRAELGYMFLPECHGKGIATEAVKTVLAYGFGPMGLHSVEAIIDPDNGASARVLEKNGFVKEGHFIENGFFDGKFIDAAVYSLLSRNFSP